MEEERKIQGRGTVIMTKVKWRMGKRWEEMMIPVHRIKSRKKVVLVKQILSKWISFFKFGFSICSQTVANLSVGTVFKYFFFFNVDLFLRDRDTRIVSRGGAEREGDTKSEAGSWLWAVSTEPHAGSNPRAARSWPEPKSGELFS